MALQVGLELQERELSFSKVELQTPNTAKAWDPSGLILTPSPGAQMQQYPNERPWKD